VIDVQLMITESIRAYLIRELFLGESAEALSEDQPLVTSGLLDSVATLRLVLFLEEQFNIVIDTADIADGKLDTMRSIEALIWAKRDALSTSG
jgi:acyl carrier protein